MSEGHAGGKSEVGLRNYGTGGREVGRAQAWSSAVVLSYVYMATT